VSVHSFIRLLLPLALLFSLSACQRGCLSTWLTSRGFGSRPGGSLTDARAAGFDLGGTDCSDGLARCVAGRVEISRAAHLPYPCVDPGTSPEHHTAACECPWEEIAKCTSGCALEGFTALATEDAADQLCRPLLPVARPITPADPPGGVCADEGVACVDGFIRSCEGPSRPVRLLAACLEGCDARIGVPSGDVDDPPKAGVAPLRGIDDVDEVDTEHALGSIGSPAHPSELSAILCRRNHAERQ
jgi:hypothetical protein